MYPVDQFCAIINPPQVNHTFNDVQLITDMCVFKLLNSGASSIGLQAGILAVGRGNKVVEALIGADGESSNILLCVFRPSGYCFDSVMTSFCHCFRS